MPEIKILHIISYSSQDPKFPVENLIKGTGAWLCSPEDHSGSLRAEFQLQKATAIDFIDIGNSNSAMLSIEVGSSTWPSSQSFQPLLPTVMLISPVDWRAGKNSKTVQMFKKENFDVSNASKKWDRIRVICSNPFRKDAQYGLEFLKLYVQEDSFVSNYNGTDLPISSSVEGIDKRSKFMSHVNCNAKSTNFVMSSSLRSLETNRMNTGNSDGYNSSFTEIKSPMSRAAKLVMAKKHVPNHGDAVKEKKELEMEGLTFLIRCNLSADDINNLKVSHIREEFELKRNKALSTREKLIFKNIALDFAAQRLKKMDEEAALAFPEPINLEWQSGSTPQSAAKTFNFKSDISKVSINKSQTESSISDEFDKFNNEIKNAFCNRPISAKRIRLREEENITPQTPTGIDRNNLALVDCVVTADSVQRSRKKIKNSGNNNVPSPSSTLNVWLSPNQENYRKPKNLFKIKSTKNSKDKKLYKSKETCSVDSSSDSDSECIPLKEVNLQKNTVHSSFTIGSKSKNKFGIQQDCSKWNNESVSLLECPICTDFFSSESIEEHASQCSIEQLRNQQQEMVTMEECPICSEMHIASTLKEHAEQCADKHFA